MKKSAQREDKSRNTTKSFTSKSKGDNVELSFVHKYMPQGIKEITERTRAHGDALALGGEEGRDKLRKAAASGKYTVTRRYPNGATRRERSLHQSETTEANVGN